MSFLELGLKTALCGGGMLTYFLSEITQSGEIQLTCLKQPYRHTLVVKDRQHSYEYSPVSEPKSEFTELVKT